MDDSNQPVEIEPRRPAAISVGESRYAFAPAGAFPPIDFAALYTSIFRRKGKLLLGWAFLGMTAALVIALFQTPYYRARASVELDGVNDVYLSIRDVSPEATTSQTDTYMQTQANVLDSEMVVRRALEKIPSQKGPKKRSLIDINGLLQRMGLKPVTPLTADHLVVRRVMQNLRVRPIPLTRMIEVTYDDTEPNAAADFTNTLINEYIATSVERRWAATQNTERWLTGYVSHLKENLEQSGRTLESYAHDSGLLGPSENDTPAQAKLRDLEAELSKAHGEHINKQALYDTVANGPREGISPSINPSPLREYQAKLSDLRSERAQAVATLTPAHYKVRRVEAQIREIEQLIAKEWEKTLTLIRSEFQAAQRRENLLTDSVQAQMALVAEQAGKRVHYDVLRTDLETNQRLYDTILQKTKESAILSATKPTNIHLVDPARPPAPSTPSLPIYGTVGSLSGLFVGLLWAAYYERRDNKLIAPGMLPEWARIRELGIIPSATIDRDLSEPSVPFGFRPQRRLRPMLAPAGAFLFSESFYAAVASILRAECNGIHPRIITITSAMSGEGKTTVVTNLGLALSNIRRRVVLIEGDLRHPRLSKNFKIANSWGLTDILQSANPFKDMPLEALVKRTEKPGLYVLPSGPSVVSASRLLHSPAMGDLLEALAQQVDLILIDSPPLLAVSDGRILGSASDAAIVVIRAHKTTRATFQIAAQQLIDDGTPLLGIILNDWNPRRARGARDPFQYQYSYRE